MTGYKHGYGAAGSTKERVAVLDPGFARRRVNVLAIIQAFVVPVGIFLGTSALLSFWLHYDHPQVVYFLVVCGFLASALFSAKVLLPRLRHGGEDFGGEPTWLLFLGASCTLAWLAGSALGCLNYASRMEPYYDIASLSTAMNVDPRDIPGSHYMDAGRVVFRSGSFVRGNLSMGFKDGDMYCVAPIVFGDQNVPLASYDYWAVGVNCCNPGKPAFFGCGNMFDPEAHGGVRWMSNGERPQFRLAIQQAEEEYGIFAQHPLFFTWAKDPVAETEGWQAAGERTFITGGLVFSAFHALCVAAAVVAFSQGAGSGLL